MSRWMVEDFLQKSDNVSYSCHMMLRDPDRALPHVRRALALSLRLEPAAGLARAHNNLGHVLYRLENYDVAHEHLAEALKLDRIAGSSKALIARRLTHLARVAQDRKMPLEAESWLRQVEELITDADAEAPEMLWARQHARVLLVELSNGSTAEDLLTAMKLEMDAAQGTETPQDLYAVLTHNLGLSYCALGKTAQGVPLLRESLSLGLRIWGEGHNETLTRQLHLADALIGEDDGEARALLKAASNVLSPELQDSAVVIMRISAVALRLAQRDDDPDELKAATENLRKALSQVSASSVVDEDELALIASLLAHHS